ncbi:MAG: ADP-ribosylglycohydrolase family protein [Spirochaetales bacterium]|nr:ADP-ribosylglycohydrolase family protein [Spirochaetales bacterium]
MNVSVPEKPLVSSYWVIPGKLLAGEYPREVADSASRARLEAMILAGISTFIDLTTPRDGLEPYADLLDAVSRGHAKRMSFGIDDMSVPSSPRLMKSILDTIDRELAAGHGVYVHCWGGIGRTGTVIGCWLKRHGRDDLPQLWKTNPKSKQYPDSPQTDEQRAYIASWPKPADTALLARARGALIGQLAGDSLGSLVEFRSPADILSQYPEGVRQLAAGGTFGILAGQPTDDSEMALLLARSLVANGSFVAEDVLGRYVYWLESGPFDCGSTVRASLHGRRNPESQANGALMRVSPIGIAGAMLPLETVAAWAEADASLTHPNPVCLQVNALYAMAIATAVREGCTPEALYRSIHTWAEERCVDKAVTDAIERAETEAPADFMSQQGWVLIAFQNALFQLLHAASFEEGVVDTVMRGGDTDTNAAIAGALLGAVHGIDAVPEQWLEAILSCRPWEVDSRVRHARPECFWPVDALELAERLISL